MKEFQVTRPLETVKNSLSGVIITTTIEREQYRRRGKPHLPCTFIINSTNDAYNNTGACKNTRTFYRAKRLYCPPGGRRRGGGRQKRGLLKAPAPVPLPPRRHDSASAGMDECDCYGLSGGFLRVSWRNRKINCGRVAFFEL